MIYSFTPTLQEEDDGRWSAWIGDLPGCATWGYTKEEALQALHDAATLVLEDMIECGETVPPAKMDSGDVIQMTIPA